MTWIFYRLFPSVLGLLVWLVLSLSLALFGVLWLCALTVMTLANTIISYLMQRRQRQRIKNILQQSRRVKN
jgi:hypothetical protein